MKKFEMLKENFNEKMPEEMVKRMVVSRTKPITKRFGLEDVKIEDIKEDEKSYYVELDLTDEQFERIPLGLRRFFN